MYLPEKEAIRLATIVLSKLPNNLPAGYIPTHDEIREILKREVGHHAGATRMINIVASKLRHI